MEMAGNELKLRKNGDGDSDIQEMWDTIASEIDKMKAVHQNSVLSDVDFFLCISSLRNFLIFLSCFMWKIIGL
ncbi:hypothetical protein LIER_13429 [Lithospermum erythrorhizon]|uniref:Uncharacterized protein n=1 Tax=Lithospermum erythrorhizon TaxID=34254 RepID=A0AAV3PZZ8_LITER